MEFITNNAVLISGLILLIAYVFIALEKIPKMTVALIGAGLTVVLGLVSQTKTIDGLLNQNYFANFIDFNVIFFASFNDGYSFNHDKKWGI
ncbi:MAG: hypothetical protein E7Z93_00380 [Cyanobacteria bacterium SIG32]|nr:hypothetical protein [Cyanobacteria bacterium SIG32]